MAAMAPGPSVHPVAREGFADADLYERARPGYPPEVVAWLVDHLRLGPSRVAVDLAAGTGKLTRLLVASGARLLAVEPVAGMRTVLAGVCRGVPVVAAGAERLPLRTGSADAVTVAQAFHWFDADAAFGELHRVLRPGGRVGLVWNVRDRSVDWVDRIWAVMDRVERRAPWRDHDRADDDVAVLPRAEQAAVLAEVRAVLSTHPDTAGRREVLIPYRVDCLWVERR